MGKASLVIAERKMQGLWLLQAREMDLKTIQPLILGLHDEAQRTRMPRSWQRSCIKTKGTECFLPFLLSLVPLVPTEVFLPLLHLAQAGFYLAYEDTVWGLSAEM